MNTHRDPAITTPPLVLTMGEPGGIGSEITVKAWNRLKNTKEVFFVIASARQFKNLRCPIQIIEHPDECAAHFPDGLPVLSIAKNLEFEPGIAAEKNSVHVLASIRTAVELVSSGDAAGIVTNPIQKSTLTASGFSFPGHTEFLFNLTKSSDTRSNSAPIMMIAGPHLKTVPITIHLPLSEAISALTSEKIIHAGLTVATALKRDFNIASPRLAFSGLNPHAGEDGSLGRQEEEIIIPAISALKKRGIITTGPLPADTMFHTEARELYDVALCMYHDQALIPAKTLNFHEAVNITLGIPIIRTSPDHGTALDIAGKGIAREDSLVAAIKLAGRMAANRIAAHG